MKILESAWFTSLNCLVGIVLCESDGEIKCFIGALSIASKAESSDARFIADYGARFPLPAARYLFPFQLVAINDQIQRNERAQEGL